jgi:hypothetical protein
MASYQLTDEEVKSIVKKAHMYVEKTSSYRQWCPVVSIPDGYTHEWYIQTKVPGAESSKDGRDYKNVQTAYTTATADIQSYRYGFSIPRVVVEMSRNAGKDIWGDNIAAALKHLDLDIAHLVLEGSHSWDKVTINGLRDGGTDIGGTTDGDAWGTVTKPFTNANECWQAMSSAGFQGPYNWIVSDNVGLYLNSKYGAGDPAEKLIIQETFDVTIYLEDIGTSTELTTYPIAPASADDGVFFWVKSDPSVFYLAEVFAPKVTLNPTLNEKLNAFEGYIEWRGTVAVVQATGIQYTNSVNIA